MNVVNRQINPARTEAEVVARFPASTSQAQFYFLDKMLPGDPSLNVTMRWQVTGEVAADVFERAFRHVISRHEILRTRLVFEDGEPVQEVLSHVDFNLARLDFSAVAHADRDAKIAQAFAKLARKSFDLGAGGMIRATHIRLAPDLAVLLIVVHHSIFDGFSIGVLSDEVGTAAAAFVRGATPDLPELALQFGDYTLWKQQLLASGVADEDTAYWKNQLSGAHYFELVPDHERPENRSGRVESLMLPLGPDFDARITAAAQARQVSRFVIGAAVVSDCLQQMTGQPEVIFGTPIAGRVETELEHVIGPLVGSHALRIKPRGEGSMDAHIAATKTMVEGALAHQHLPFSKVVAAVNPPRDSSRSPIVSTFFNLLQMFLQERDFGPFILTSQPPIISGSNRDLDITMIRRPQGWQLSLDYAADLFEPETVKKIATGIARAFEQFFQDAGLATSVETRQALPALSVVPDDLTRIEADLLAHPDVREAVAIKTGDRPYAYVSPQQNCATPLEKLPQQLMQTLTVKATGISVLMRLPRLPTGAIDFENLPEPSLQLVDPVVQLHPANLAETETKIAAIWRDLLGLSQIAPNVSFFDVGGHSLLAVRLTAALRAAFPGDHAVADVYENPTISGLARLVAQGGQDTPASQADWRIEPLVSEGTGTPIIAVNDIAIMLSAAQQMAERHKATCVRLFENNRGLDVSNMSFREIAEAYAAVIRQAQPEGPYLLFGVCVHGNIALEAARVLQHQGAEVLGVVMKDVWEPGYVERVHANPKMKRQNKIASLRNKIRMVRAGTLSRDAFLGSYRILRNTGVLRLAKALGVVKRIRESDLEPEQERFVLGVSAARNVYRPDPITFPVLHVVTRISVRGKGFDLSIGWERIVRGGLKTVEIDEIVAYGGKQIGTKELAEEIDRFVAEVTPHKIAAQ